MHVFSFLTANRRVLEKKELAAQIKAKRRKDVKLDACSETKYGSVNSTHSSPSSGYQPTPSMVSYQFDPALDHVQQNEDVALVFMIWHQGGNNEDIVISNRHRQEGPKFTLSQTHTVWTSTSLAMAEKQAHQPGGSCSMPGGQSVRARPGVKRWDFAPNPHLLPPVPTRRTLK
jgi:hypothetical protein